MPTIYEYTKYNEIFITICDFQGKDQIVFVGFAKCRLFSYSRRKCVYYLAYKTRYIVTKLFLIKT